MKKRIHIPSTGETITSFIPIGFPSDYPLLNIIADNAVTVLDSNGHFLRHMGTDALKRYLRNKKYYETEIDR